MAWQFCLSRAQTAEGAPASTAHIHIARARLWEDALFPLDPTDEQLQEPVRIRCEAHSRIRLQRDDSLDFVMIPVQHVVFVGTHTVCHRLATRKLSLCFHIEVHLLERNESRID